MDGYLFFENFPPWTPLFGPGRLLIFGNIFSKSSEIWKKKLNLRIPRISCYHIDIYYTMGTQCFPKNPPWTIIPPWTFISLLGMFHPGRLIGPGRLFGRAEYGVKGVCLFCIFECQKFKFFKTYGKKVMRMAPENLIKSLKVY